MKSLKSIRRKSERAKARRKDYQKKQNVRRNNKKAWSTPLKEGDGILPKSRKFMQSKKKVKESIINNLSRGAEARK